LTLALSPRPDSALTLAQVRLIAENDLRTALTTQPHIANVEIFGGYEPALRVEFDPLQLAHYRISPAQLQELIARLDRDYPAGISQGADGLTTWRCAACRSATA